MRPLPPGYEVRTVNGNNRSDGELVQVVPYYLGQPIAKGRYPSIYGYGGAIRAARKVIRLHHRYNIDSRKRQDI